jgi:nitrogen fixation NifU-like protein
MSAPSAAVLEHLRHPRRGGSFGSGEPGVRRGGAGSFDSGRRIELELRLGGDGVVCDARFRAFGCAALLACGSWLAERACGARAGELARLDERALVRALELRPEEAICARLALRALRRALGAAA